METSEVSKTLEALSPRKGHIFLSPDQGQHPSILSLHGGTKPVISGNAMMGTGQHLAYYRSQIVTFDVLRRSHLIGTLGHPQIAMLILAMLGCGTNPSTVSEQEDKPLNFVLIYTDELQFSDIGAYGGKFPTPNIDQLAAEGIRFTQAHTTASMCTPSRFSLMTGQMAGRCTSRKFLASNPVDNPYSIAWNTHIESDMATIPRLLAEQGYISGMAGKWHIGSLPAAARVPDFLPEEDPKDSVTQVKLRAYQEVTSAYLRSSAGFDVTNSVLWGNFDGFPIKALHYHNIPWITKGGIEFLDSVSTGDRPFFLYIAPTAIHGPNHQENLTEDLRYTVEGYMPEVVECQPDSSGLIQAANSYSPIDAHRFAGIAHIDHQVGLLVADLKAKGLYDHTAIIFMADHNIEPGKATCYHKGTNVPLIIRWPGTKPGQVSDALVSNVDILPTLVTAAGASETGGDSTDGVSLMPLLSGDQSTVRDHTFSEAGYSRSVFDGRFKYIALRFPEAVNERIKSGGLVLAPNHLNVPRQAHSRIAAKYHQDYFDGDQLYDTQNDPYEQSNLANDPEFEDQLKRLRSVLQQQVASLDHPFDLDDATLGSAQYEQLSIMAREAIDLSDIDWFMRDHGSMVWPPEE